MEPHVDRDRLFGDLNEGILAERRRAFERNLRHNLPLIRRYGGLKRIIPELGGKGAVVIGAGPSLEKNLGLLKRFSRNIVTGRSAQCRPHRRVQVPG